MFIGGSPSGTAGGIKTTTMAVLVLTVVSIIKGRRDTEMFARRVSDMAVRRALSIFAVSFGVMLGATVILAAVQPGNFIDCLYEIVSAIATVGLSRDFTPHLTTVSRLIIIVTMYIGRIGPISLALFFNSKRFVNVKRTRKSGFLLDRRNTMKRKEFVVFGVGDFGMYVAKTLANSGATVMVVDKDEERLEQIASEVTHTICADATNPEAVKQLGIGNYDGAIIGIGRSLETSALITMQLKELNVPFIMAKASTDMEGRILSRIGADKVIFLTVQWESVLATIL